MIYMYRFLLIITYSALWAMDNTEAAVNGPKFVDTPIRLANAKRTDDLMKSSSQAGGNFQTTLDTSQSSASMNRATLSDARSDILSASTNNERISMKQDRVVILEPPTGSLLEGNKFVVTLKIQSANETQFRQSYIENNEGRICLSLDRSPYVCWPPYGRMFFTHATEGEHEIVAMLLRNGVLEEFTASERVTFTTVLNPQIVQEPHNGMTPHDISLESYSNVGHGHHDNREALNHSDSANVDVMFPIVQITSPMNKVSYTGTSLPFESVLPTLGDDANAVFEKYFQTAFVCINLDIATAFSCFPIYGSSNQTWNKTDHTHHAIVPWLVGLSKGMHTIEAMLSHPETGELLTASNPGTVMFFMAGDKNEDAAFVGSINIRGQRYEIPIMAGGCIEAQTQAFCSRIGLSDVKACLDPVLSHLKEIAVQIGFVSIPC